MTKKKKPPHFDLLGDYEDNIPPPPLEPVEQFRFNDYATARPGRRSCGDCGAPWLMNLDGSTKAAACVECGFLISCTLEPRQCVQCHGRMGGYRDDLCNRCQPRPPADLDDVIDTHGEEVSRRKA
jgi:hypothetical protein